MLSQLIVTVFFTQLYYLDGFSQYYVKRRLFSKTHRSLSNKAVADAQSESSTSYHSSDTVLKLFSPCKVNLFLRILRKREDGYHDLASLFQTIGFGDLLELNLINGQEDEFECNMVGVPTDSSNLVIRALQLMRDKTGMSQTFFRANLMKQVPAQAGLGGGSANAATAMWGANELMGRPASLEQVSRSLREVIKIR
jgi:hypothetical protein